MQRLTRHLDEVEESYFEHLRHALSFSVTLLFGAFCCLVHAFLPFLFEKRGSSLVQGLHDRMVVHRKGLGKNLKRGNKQTTGEQAGETSLA